MSHDILVLYYSELGGTQSLAEAVASGIESVPGVSARIRTVPEVCAVNGMAPTAHGREYPPLHSPVYATHEDLDECIGLALGSPTRFGNMAAPLKVSRYHQRPLDEWRPFRQACLCVHNSRQPTCWARIYLINHDGSSAAPWHDHRRMPLYRTCSQ